MRWASNLGTLAIIAVLSFSLPLQADEPAAKAVEKAFDKAKAIKAVDDAFKLAAIKPATAVPKTAAKAVEEAFEAAKAKGKPAKEDPATPERLPMPRQVTVSDGNPWYITYEAPPCAECATGCSCTDCVCESKTSHPAAKAEPRYVQVTVDRWAPQEPPPWTGGEIPQGWEWVGVVGNGHWRKAGVGSSALSHVQFSQNLMLASPCANGQCPAPTTGARRR
jgi:hypothetical protein